MRLRNLVRDNALIGGVAGGVAEIADVPVWIVRALMLVSVVFSAGITVFLYLAAVFSFPSRLQLRAFGETPKIFGLCYRMSKRLGVPVGWLRFCVLSFAIFTMFVPVAMVYFILHLVLEDEPSRYEARGPRAGNVRDLN